MNVASNAFPPHGKRVDNFNSMRGEEGRSPNTKFRTEKYKFSGKMGELEIRVFLGRHVFM